MGFAWDDDLVELTCPDGGKVWIKAKMSSQDKMLAQNAAMTLKTQIDPETGDVREIGSPMDLATLSLGILERMVKRWDYTRDGEAVPINLDTLGQLDEETADFLLAEINKRNPKRTKKSKKDFTTAS